MKRYFLVDFIKMGQNMFSANTGFGLLKNLNTVPSFILSTRGWASQPPDPVEDVGGDIQRDVALPLLFSSG